METNLIESLQYLLHNTDMLGHIGLMFAASILVGALLLDFGNYWRWVLAFVVFVVLLQGQVNSLAITQDAPGGVLHVSILNTVRASAAIAFVAGISLGVLLKKKWASYYTRKEDELDKVSSDILKKVSLNGIEEV